MVLKLDGKSEIGAHVGAISVIWYDEGIWSDKEQSKNCFFIRKDLFTKIISINITAIIDKKISLYKRPI